MSEKVTELWADIGRLQARLRRLEFVEVECDANIARAKAAEAEVDRLKDALAVAERERDRLAYVNHLLQVEIGNTKAARTDYEEAWHWAEAARESAERERDEARAELENRKAGPSVYYPGPARN